MGIPASRDEYRKGYYKHYSACYQLKQSHNKENTNSYNLLLFYTVENGLKYMLLKKWNIYISDSKKMDLNQQRILYSHDIEQMLIELGMGQCFKFPTLKLMQSKLIRLNDYHLICRYCIKLINDDRNEQKVIEELNNVAIWIREKI